MPTLEERIQRLDDIEAIRRLKLEYARHMSTPHPTDGPFPSEEFLNLFTDDIIWDAENIGRHEGKVALREFLTKLGGWVELAVQYMTNHAIDIAPSGTEATGRWLIWEPSINVGRALFNAATYKDEYKKVDGCWRFHRINVRLHFMTPYESGWVKEPWRAESEFDA